MKILDCTLRDGGYYTNWDFSQELVNHYIEYTNQLPIEYIELGYRSLSESVYRGKYFYSPLNVLKTFRSLSNKKIGVLIEEKNLSISEINNLLSPCIGLIDFVRIAVAPSKIPDAILLAEAIKKLGFEVGLNIMYLSKWPDYHNSFKFLEKANGIIDFVYMVDSYGSVFPEELNDSFELIKSFIDIPIGFHGHNNMELAFANSLNAMLSGCEMIDSTILGMGRGAGNLKTELLLTYLASKVKMEIDFSALSSLVQLFDNLLKQYEWGTNLPYMFSGANSLPQKDVMEWVSKRYYSFNTIITALNHQKSQNHPYIKFPLFEPLIMTDKVLVIGGGDSIREASNELLIYLENNPEIIIIHASSKNANYFKSLKNHQLFCLIGNEADRMLSVLNGTLPLNFRCILPPSPRVMDIIVPVEFHSNTFELSKINLFENEYSSHTALALQPVSISTP
jgi:4-hydroxy 2-oxovalerate aldolase